MDLGKSINPAIDIGQVSHCCIDGHVQSENYDAIWHSVGVCALYDRFFGASLIQEQTEQHTKCVPAWCH